MQIRLLRPEVASQGWQIAAERIPTAADHARFEAAIRDLDPRIGLVLRKDGRSRCVYEYDWTLAEHDARRHAQSVAQALKAEFAA